jgi:serine/threonine protein kinase
MKPDEQRAYDHYRWADRYNRQKQPKKAAAHLRRAVQLQRDARFGADPGFNKKLVLLEPILGGASRSPVFQATVDGESAVCKVMGRSELENLNKAQGPGVVRILHVSEDVSTAEGPGSTELRSMYDATGGMPPGSVIVAMEKLGDVQFHPRHDQGGHRDTIDTVYSLEERVKDGVRYPVRSPGQPMLRYLREFLDAIVALNKRGLMWCDVKQENSGIDREFHLRIFDFGTFTRRIADENRYVDILAYGKLLYNALVGLYAFAPGRHCRAHRFALSKEQLVSTVDLISGAPVGVSHALRECFSLDEKSKPDSVVLVVDLLNTALRELGA